MDQRIANIPIQLRECAQWINWRYATDDKGKMTKQPINPFNGQLANVTDSGCYASFEIALGNAENFGVGIGFVLTENDPFVCIDLDDPVGKINPMQHEQIYKNFNNIIDDADSYTEWSPSGNGAHVWLMADVPPNGVRSPEDCIELYSTARFITFTGNSFHPQAKPLNRNDELAQAIHSALDRRSGRDIDVVEKPAQHTPQQLLEHILTWQNADVFRKLINTPFGEGDDSAIDQGVMNFIVQACRNVELARATFNLTGRAKRAKWQDRRDYQNRTIRRAFDKLENIPEVDVSGLVRMIKDQIRTAKEVIEISKQDHAAPVSAPLAQASEAPAAVLEAVSSQDTVANGVQAAQQGAQAAVVGSDADSPAWAVVPSYDTSGDVHGPGCFRNPGGLLGALMNHFYRSAYKPNPEVALAAALGTMAAVAGRAYNAGGLGLNLYIVLLANTGVGKNTAMQGPTDIIKTVATKNSAFRTFIGDRHASAQALVKSFSSKNSFCSFFDEFGELFQRMTSGNQADANMANMLGPMMELYTASGRKGTLPAMLHSNKDNSSKEIQSPSFSFVGASVPKTFYECLSSDMATKGLLSRLSIINVETVSDRFNDQSHLVKPPVDLLDGLYTLCQTAHQVNGGYPHSPIDVRFTDEADAQWKLFRDHCDEQVRRYAEQDDVIAALWSRCAEKARKIAGIVAVGYNPYAPMCDESMVKWAIEFAHHDVTLLAGKFANGETGKADNEAERIEQFKRAIRRFFEKDHDRNSWVQCKIAGWIPKGWFTRDLTKMAAFKTVRNGSISPLEAVDLTLKHLVSFGDLKVVTDSKYPNGEPVDVTCYRVAHANWLRS